MESENLESKGYSESIVSGRLHQSCGLEGKSVARIARESLLGPVASTIHKM